MSSPNYFICFNICYLLFKYIYIDGCNQTFGNGKGFGWLSHVLIYIDMSKTYIKDGYIYIYVWTAGKKKRRRNIKVGVWYIHPKYGCSHLFVPIISWFSSQKQCKGTKNFVCQQPFLHNLKWNRKKIFFNQLAEFSSLD